MNYSVDMKGGLVTKAQDLIRKGLLEFDAGWMDLAASFMATQKNMTSSGGKSLTRLVVRKAILMISSQPVSAGFFTPAF
ncbi:hypothetical protein [Iodobacter violaceini]|uniref:phage terminase large subunit family protein n=1 Tax=Iodobacter violaceini TaxID=3044271 RepID=UPI00350E5AA1